MTVTLEGGQLVIRSNYDPELVAQIRQLPQRRWDPVEKVWYVAPKYHKEVKRIADNFSLDFTAIDIPEEITAEVKVSYELGTFFITFPYDITLLEKVRAIPRARYSPIMVAWSAPKESAVEVLQFADDVKAFVDSSCDAILAEAKKDAEQVSASRATTSLFEVKGLGGELMPFQRAGVEYAVKARKTFIADEMGLGKTVQALATIHHLQAYPAVIVTPASLKINWMREGKKWIPGKKFALLRGRHGDIPNADVLVVNYDILDYWALKVRDVKAVVFDESHYCKNPKAKRTKAAIVLADKSKDVVLCLSGTPILNNATELTAQLRILGRLKEFGGATKFRETFSSTRHLPELNRKLRATMYVRRRKVDVLTELPPKRWSDIIVEPSGEGYKKYQQAEADLVSFLATQAHLNAEKSGATTQQAREAALIAAMRAQAAEQLVAVNTLKRLASEAKYSSAIEWIDNFLNSGNKLIVFTWHNDLANKIADHYKAVKLTGKTELESRNKAIDEFQNNPECKVFVSTMKAGGIGITLTASSDVLFLEQGWTPADMDQAADRAHRIGQRDSVTAWTLIAEGTIDEDIKELIAYKRELVDATTDGKQLEDKQNILTDLLVRLARKGNNASI